MDMEEKIQKELERYCLDGIQLTEEETEALKDEIRRQEQGHLMLDGILTDPKFLKRKWDLVFGSDSEGTNAETVSDEGQS